MIIVFIISFYMIFQYVSCKVNAGYGRMQRAEVWFRTIVLFEAIVLILTNLLSILHIMTRAVDFVAWLVITIIFAFLYGKNKYDRTLETISVVKVFQNVANPYSKNAVIQLKKNGNDKLFLNSDDSFLKNAGKKSASEKSKSEKALIWIMLAILGILSLVLLFGAIFTVPYNYDSMTYHLARIGYWIDHKSVAHYITNIDRQVYSPVLAEYNLLHMMLLSGNDTFLNFFQYFCMFAAAYFIYKCAQKLGVNRLFALFGAFIFMLMPLTISQSITTQNDLFAALIFILFVYKLLDVICYDKIILNAEQTLDIVMLGLLVGYAYLAKTSVCASMVMFMPWLLIARLRKKDDFKKLIGSVGIALAGIVVTISETLIRTFLSSGSLMTSTASGNIMVATKNVKYIIVNILKNFSMLITQNYYRPLNGFIYRIAIGAGEKLQVEVNHEAIAFHGFDFLHHMNMGDDMYSHDKTPSAFVAYLAVIAGVILIGMIVVAVFKRLAHRKIQEISNKKITENAVNVENKEYEETTENQEFVSIGFAISAWLSLGFIMALLRWQPWGTRLMYPALAVTVIMSVNMLYCLMRRWKKPVTAAVLGILIVLATMLAVPSVSYNLQPAVEFVKGGCQNRINQYFKSNHREDGYAKMIELAQNDQAKDIGLIISGDGYDYPLWLMLRKDYPEAKLRHLIKENASDVTQKTPDCIFMIERDVLEVGETFEYAGVVYTCAYKNDTSGDCYLEKNE
ncbi:MAG: hypothetical protein IIX48_06965 [Lachnospiraceae bacterium]|nr:hypothetical protein [Lachnospiraceae bacterium]